MEALRDLKPENQRLIQLLLYNNRYQVSLEGKYGKPFDTNIGVPQGDCLSPKLFCVYLAKCLEQMTTKTIHHLEYADDCAWITKDQHTARKLMEEMINKQIDTNLKINEAKTQMIQLPQEKDYLET